MASKTEIANLALSHLAVDKEIANIETESSKEASSARRFYDLARDMVLRDFSWPFATKIAALALIETEPNTEWAFSYRYPTDCLYFRRILSGLRNDSRDTRAPYRIAQDDDGTTIVFTDADDAQAEYTVKTDNPQIYPPDFTLALSYLLASLMAARVTAGDPYKLGQRALSMYQAMKAKAENTARNEEQAEEEPESEFIRARD
jgi:hypothetical protein